MSNQKRHVFKVEIEAPAEKVWQAIVEPEMTRQYFHETGFTAAGLHPGAGYAYKNGDGADVLVGEILEFEPPFRMVTTFSARWSDEIAAESPSRVTWEITQEGSRSIVTVTHDHLDDSPITFESVVGGWPEILEGLKQLVETGRVTAAA
jgi:uncharacterized protein YndB with AHSA1/START domain